MVKSEYKTKGKVMINANERAQDGLELFEVNGQQSFEMENDTLKMCASEDGTLHRSVRGLDVRDADGNCVFSLSWSETGVCGTLHDENFSVEITEEF
tara:strand:+ start:41 stop:331 length:291 start_codon:yes stop_codon:yes gene_type:complete